MTAFLIPLIIVSAVGLISSLIIHIAALLGIDLGFGSNIYLLHMGILVVWVPTVLVFNKMTGNCKRSEVWKVALRGCPGWMRNMTYGFFVYAFINFIIFVIMDSHHPSNPHGMATPQMIRGFSGHWMAFYSAALATLFSARELRLSDVKCMNGHVVSPLAKYCEQCGSPIKQN
jgi:hypothetical protein